jgi:hypothetical protein
MTTPGFTAEASLGKTRQSYVLRSGTAAGIESVLPQFFPMGTDLPTSRIVCIGGHCYQIWTDMTGQVHGVQIS